jgi:hypothetical protein
VLHSPNQRPLAKKNRYLTQLRSRHSANPDLDHPPHPSSTHCRTNEPPSPVEGRLRPQLPLPLAQRLTIRLSGPSQNSKPAPDPQCLPRSSRIARQSHAVIPGPRGPPQTSIASPTHLRVSIQTRPSSQTFKAASDLTLPMRRPTPLSKPVTSQILKAPSPRLALIFTSDAPVERRGRSPRHPSRPQASLCLHDSPRSTSNHAPNPLLEGPLASPHLQLPLAHASTRPCFPDLEGCLRHPLLPPTPARASNAPPVIHFQGCIRLPLLLPLHAYSSAKTAHSADLRAHL